MFVTHKAATVGDTVGVETDCPVHPAIRTTETRPNPRRDANLGIENCRSPQPHHPNIGTSSLAIHDVLL
jgi:hypothetical protein